MSTSTAGSQPATDRHATDKPGSGVAAKIVGAWTVVGIPLAYGVYQTAKKASALFV